MMRNGSLGFVGAPLLASTANAQPADTSKRCRIHKTGNDRHPGRNCSRRDDRANRTNEEIGTLKKGTTEFTCFIGNDVPMCSDPNAMEWAKAWQTHAPPPDKVGFIYMLNGDNGASNTDPWATKADSGNHWIKTASHVMIVGPPAKTMIGYPETEDPDPRRRLAAKLTI